MCIMWELEGASGVLFSVSGAKDFSSFFLKIFFITCSGCLWYFKFSSWESGIELNNTMGIANALCCDVCASVFGLLCWHSTRMALSQNGKNSGSINSCRTRLKPEIMLLDNKSLFRTHAEGCVALFDLKKENSPNVLKCPVSVEDYGQSLAGPNESKECRISHQDSHWDMVTYTQILVCVVFFLQKSIMSSTIRIFYTILIFLGWWLYISHIYNWICVFGNLWLFTCHDQPV